MSKKSKVMLCTPLKLASERLEIIEAAPTSGGKRFLLKHLQGESLTRDQAIKAMCCDCSGYYIDGRTDCKTEHCPLYTFMPYRGAGHE